MTDRRVLVACATAIVALGCVSLASAAPLTVNCLPDDGGAPVRRVKPRACTIPTNGSPTPSNADRLRLVSLQWLTWGTGFAIARGVSLPNHRPMTRRPIVVVLHASDDPGDCPGGYDSAVVVWRTFEQTASLTCW